MNEEVLMLETLLVVTSALLAVAVVVLARLRTPAAPPAPVAGPWETHRRATVLVSLTGGDAYRGALWDSGPEGVTLRAAELVLENRTAPVEGELLIPARRIDVIQVLGAG